MTDAPPTLREIPIGLDATGHRRRFDSMGTVDGPADKYWGAQTARSLVNQAEGQGATLESGHVDAATFERVVDPKAMTGHGVRGA